MTQKNEQEKGDWDAAPVDIDFIIKSGLLFEINRQLLNPLGISMTVRVLPGGEKTWGFKDCRQSPESAVYQPEVLELNRRKFVRFMKAHGDRLLRRRVKKLGQSCQHVCPTWE